MAFVLVAGMLRERREMTTAAVPSRTIAAGEPVAIEDFRVVELPVSPGVTGLLVTESDVQAGGLVALRLLADGEPVVRSAVGSGSARPASRVMALQLDGWGDVGGELAVGDQIDVIDTRGETAEFVVKSATVVGRPTGDDVGGLTGRREVWVAIEVDEQEALRLAEVVAANRFVLVRSTGVDS